MSLDQIKQRITRAVEAVAPPAAGIKTLPELIAVSKVQPDERVRAVKTNSKLAYEIEGDGARDGAVRAVLGKKSYAAEELVGMTLEYAMAIGEAAGRGKIRDAVIAVPPLRRNRSEGRCGMRRRSLG